MGRADALSANEESIMAYTGYFKTEKNVGAKWNGWLWLATYINKVPGRTIRRLSTGSTHYIWNWATVQNIYCHQNAADEPSGDGRILTSIFDDTETEYSGAEGYIKSFTSSDPTGANRLFTSNQDFSVHPAWTVWFTAKNDGVSPGYQGVFRLEVYKRNTSNVDTFLFSSEYQPITSIYPSAGLSMPMYPSGTVTTSDRLRLRIYMYEALPT
jgi:hypothetical protein